MLDLADAHCAALRHLLKSLPSHHRWVAVTAMYTALPVVDRVLDKENGEPPGSHKARTIALIRDPKFRKVHNLYRILEREAWVARYGAGRTNVQAIDMVTVIVKGALIPTLVACKEFLDASDQTSVDGTIQSVLSTVKEL